MIIDARTSLLPMAGARHAAYSREDIANAGISRTYAAAKEPNLTEPGRHRLCPTFRTPTRGGETNLACTTPGVR